MEENGVMMKGISVQRKTPERKKNEKMMSDDRVQQEKSDLNSRKPKAKSKPNQPKLT